MARKFYGIGLNFGKQRNGYFSVSSDKKLIKESITSIMMTRPAERIHLPDYGVGLDRYLFEPNDDIMGSVLRNRIIEQIEKWESGVTVENVEMLRDENTLTVRLTIKFNDFENELYRTEYSVGG
jgi:phage baseplate assembly protein W